MAELGSAQTSGESDRRVELTTVNQRRGFDGRGQEKLMQCDYFVKFLVEDVPRDVEEALLSDGRFAVDGAVGP